MKCQTSFLVGGFMIHFTKCDVAGVTDEDKGMFPSMSCNKQHSFIMCPNCQGETFFLFTRVLPSAASSWCPSSCSTLVSCWADDGLSGKYCSGPSTCLTVIFILELWMYLEHTAQSSSVSGSITEDGERSCLASQQPSIFSAKLSSGAGTMRGTAWYRRRLCPVITMMSPLCMNIAVGGSSLHRPPRRKMADWPKLQEEEQ